MHDNAPKYIADIGAAGAVIGTLAGYLPTAAAVLAIVWYCIQIWESKTVRKWTGRIEGA